MSKEVKMADVPVWAFTDGMRPETAKPTPECPEPDRWTQMDDVAPEVEVLRFVQQWVRTSKPDRVIISGDLTGYITVYVAQALRENGFGVVASINIPSEHVEKIAKTLGQAALERWIEFAPAEQSVPGGIADAVFFDNIDHVDGSYVKRDGVVFVHDVATVEARKAVKRKIEFPSVYLPTPRGLLVFQK